MTFDEKKEKFAEKFPDELSAVAFYEDIPGTDCMYVTTIGDIVYIFDPNLWSGLRMMTKL